MSKGDRFQPISDALRKALLALDEDPKQHEREMREKLLAIKTTKAIPTKTLRQANAVLFLKRNPTRAEREEEAARLAQARRPNYPDARVMFVQHTECTGCGKQSEGCSHPQIFLRLRNLLSTGKLDLTSLQYIPESAGADYPAGRLPKIIEHHFTKVTTCPKCFINAVHSFRGESIESSGLSQEQSASLLENGSESLKQTTLRSSTENGGKSGIDPSTQQQQMEAPIECPPGSVSTSSAPVSLSALVESTHTHTRQGEERVEQEISQSRSEA